MIGDEGGCLYKFIINCGNWEISEAKVKLSFIDLDLQNV